MFRLTIKLWPIFVGCALLLLASCSKARNESGMQSVPTEVSAGTDVIATVVAMPSTSASFALRGAAPHPSWFAPLRDLFLPKTAFADELACNEPPTKAACVSDAKVAQYNACPGPGGQSSLDGEITLAYPNSQCATPPGDSFTSTFGLNRTTARRTITLSSDASVSAIDRKSYGGGAVFTVAPNGVGLQIDIPGISRKTPLDEIIAHSSVPLVVSSTSTQYTVQSGTLVLDNNDTKVRTTFAVVQPLNFDTSKCRFPSSGSIELTQTYPNGTSAGGTVAFNDSSCGAATYTPDGSVASTQTNASDN